MLAFRKGQASLEMVVGIIILLVVAAVVIALVIGIIKKPDVGPTVAEQFVEKCKSYCDSDRIREYCTSTLFSEYGIKDWNRNGFDYELISGDRWDFCEDKAYCFLVSDCQKMGEDPISYCRTYLCNDFSQKYMGNMDTATQKLKETYKVSDQLSKCCATDKSVTKCFSDLSPADNWYRSRFADLGWCGAGSGPEQCGDGVCDLQYGEDYNSCSADCGSLPAQVTLSNCIYTSADDSMTCDTNCQGKVSNGTTTLFVMDSSGNSSIAMDGTNPVGTISFSGGKVTAKPEVFSVMGAVKLSGLDSNTAAWMVSMSCQNPAGNAVFASGVTRV